MHSDTAVIKLHTTENDNKMLSQSHVMKRIFQVKHIGRGHPYTTWSDWGRGVHEMTINDHEGEGFRNDHVVKKL